MELRGEQVTLRPLADADVEPLREMRRAPEVFRFWGEMEDDFPMGDEPESTRFAVLDPNGELAGMIQYGEEPEADYRHAWIDIFLAAGRIGGGLGTDAVRTLLDHLIDDVGHHRVTIDPSLDNAGAIRSYEKAGFRRVGVLRRAWRAPEGDWRDELLLEHVAGVDR